MFLFSNFFFSEAKERMVEEDMVLTELEHTGDSFGHKTIGGFAVRKRKRKKKIEDVYLFFAGDHASDKQSNGCWYSAAPESVSTGRFCHSHRDHDRCCHSLGLFCYHDLRSHEIYSRKWKVR